MTDRLLLTIDIPGDRGDVEADLVALLIGAALMGPEIGPALRGSVVTAAWAEPPPLSAVWPPRPLTPHRFAPSDINKGIDLPCCDKDEHDPIHEQTP